MIRGEKYDESVDIWAIGIIMYELLVGKPPFEAPVSCVCLCGVGLLRWMTCLQYIHESSLFTFQGQNETIERITEGALFVPPHVSLAAKDLISRVRFLIQFRLVDAVAFLKVIAAVDSSKTP